MGANGCSGRERRSLDTPARGMVAPRCYGRPRGASTCTRRRRCCSRSGACHCPFILQRLFGAARGNKARRSDGSEPPLHPTPRRPAGPCVRSRAQRPCTRRNASTRNSARAAGTSARHYRAANAAPGWLLRLSIKGPQAHAHRRWQGTAPSQPQPRPQQQQQQQQQPRQQQPRLQQQPRQKQQQQQRQQRRHRRLTRTREREHAGTGARSATATLLPGRAPLPRASTNTCTAAFAHGDRSRKCPGALAPLPCHALSRRQARGNRYKSERRVRGKGPAAFESGRMKLVCCGSAGTGMRQAALPRKEM
eukprot:353460-Chlamydomonas_euryale.AAC.3